MVSQFMLFDIQQKAEAKKNAQDLLIDSLNEQVKSMTEQIALTQAHITAQKNETTAAAGLCFDCVVFLQLSVVSFLLLLCPLSNAQGGERRDEPDHCGEERVHAKVEEFTDCHVTP